MEIQNFSYGGAAAVLTSMALIAGLDAATATRATILSGLLIVAIADNLTDSLSIHIYQESEQLKERKAFRATLMNYATRLSLSLSFVVIVLLFPVGIAVIAAISWGLVLLTCLTVVVARSREARVFPEIIKHLLVAAVVILASKGIGYIIVNRLQ